MKIIPNKFRSFYVSFLCTVLFFIAFSGIVAKEKTTVSQLLFKSGFEEGVSLGEPYNDGGGTWYQDLIGDDGSGYTWPITIWGSKGAFQVLVDSSLTPSEYIQNSIVTMDGHDGNPTKVMHSKILKADKSWTQDPYILETTSENGDLYVKYWLKFPKNLADALGDGTNDDGWCTFFEWKTSGDYRIAAYVYVEEDGKPYWYVHGDNVAKDNFGAYKEFWYEENKKIPVPEDEWFLVEFFWHRSTEDDGRFWWSINKKVIVDHYGPNKLVEPINRIMLFTVYAEKYPFEQWVDDVEIRDNFPDMPPIVENPLSDSTVLKNSAKISIDLSGVFSDADNDDSAIIKAIYNNSNPSLLTASLSGDTLSIEYLADKTGTATITVSGTSNGITVYDEFSITVVDERITLGSKSTVNVNEVPGMDGSFTRSPKIYGIYIDPVKSKERTTSTRGITKINSSTPADEFEFEWRRKICLYNKHELSSGYKSGVATNDWLSKNPINILKCDLYIRTVSSDYSNIDEKFRLSAIVPPEITSVLTDAGKIPANGIDSGSVLLIKGKYFGSKLPKVKLEYKDAKGRIKFYKLKVLRILQYADAKGNPGKSCMNVETGESQISVEIPTKTKPGSYSLFLSNKIGIALDSVTETLPVVKINN